MKKLIPVVLGLLILISIFTPVNAVKEDTSAIKTEFEVEGSELQWQISPAVSTANLNKIACFNKKLYIAAGYGGTIRSSPDGSSWTTNTSLPVESPNELFDIACSEDSIVVVGDKGTILHSTDGFSWTVVKPATAGSIRKVIYGGKLFAAFTDKPGEILTSRDGLDWQVSDTGAESAVNDVIWNGKVYVTVGNNGEICTSLNGRIWQVKVIKNKPSFNKIAWNGKFFLTFGSTSAETDNLSYTSGVYAATSNNGYSWNFKTLSTKSMDKNSNKIYVSYCENIIWDGKQFIINQLEFTGVSPFAEGKMINYTTTDGIKFKKAGSFALNGDTSSVHLAYNGEYYLMACNNFTRPGFYYGPTVYTSRDGLKWDMVLNQNIENFRIRDIIYNDGQFILVGESGLIQYSSDGINWKQVGGEHHSPKLWNGKQYIAIENDIYGQSYIYTSDDRSNWKKQNKLPDGIWAQNLNWNGKEYTSFNYTSISTSQDLINWDTKTFENDSQIYKDVGSISAFSSNGAVYIIAGKNGTAISTDKINWTSKRMPNYYSEIILGNNSYIARNLYGQIDFSADGLNWKRIHIKDYSGTFLKVMFVDGQYSVAGSDGTIFKSPDGRNWTKAADGVNSSLISVIWTGSQFVANDYHTVYTYKNGTAWQKESVPFDIQYFSVHADDDRIYILSNGVLYYRELDG